ncbi:hypothetical protein DFH07DRAFT_1068491, partial [Mycena maculata]
MALCSPLNVVAWCGLTDPSRRDASNHRDSPSIHLAEAAYPARRAAPGAHSRTGRGRGPAYSFPPPEIAPFNSHANRLRLLTSVRPPPPRAPNSPPGSLREPSTLTLSRSLSSKDIRRRHVAKLARALAENIAPELVAEPAAPPPPRGQHHRAPQRKDRLPVPRVRGHCPHAIHTLAGEEHEPRLARSFSTATRTPHTWFVPLSMDAQELETREKELVAASGGRRRTGAGVEYRDQSGREAAHNRSSNFFHYVLSMDSVQSQNRRKWLLSSFVSQIILHHSTTITDSHPRTDV